MKSVKTLAQATKLAAMQGATLDVGGRLINAQGARLSLVRPQQADTPASEPIAPPAAPAAEAQLAQIVREQSQVLAALVDRLQTPALPSPPAPQPRMRPVSFTVVRDAESRPIALMPIYGVGAATKPAALDPVRGDDGYITEILPRY